MSYTIFGTLTFPEWVSYEIRLILQNRSNDLSIVPLVHLTTWHTYIMLQESEIQSSQWRLYKVLREIEFGILQIRSFMYVCLENCTFQFCFDLNFGNLFIDKSKYWYKRIKQPSMNDMNISTLGFWTGCWTLISRYCRKQLQKFQINFS